ncbi:cytochrome P450 [Rhizoctonia solani]|nr:cytochrome P450 [Rhizoctonia solani]
MLIAEKYKPIYGDLIRLSEPPRKKVLLNSPEVVSEVLEKQSGSTSDRPRNMILLEMTGINSLVGFPSGLHPAAAARSYADMHTSTTAFFLLDILNRIRESESSHNYHSEALVSSIQDSIGRFIMRMTFGYIVKENDPVLQRQNVLVQIVLPKFGTHFWYVTYRPDYLVLNSSDTRSTFTPIDPAGVIWGPPTPGSTYYKLHPDGFEMIVNCFQLHGDALPASYTSKLIELKGGRNINEDDVGLVKWTSGSMFAAGSSTTTTLINSFIFAMCIRPEIAAKAQAEIDTQIGRDRMPTLLDRSVLPYTDAVLQEAIRYYPVFPLGLENVASEDIEVRGYTINKGTILEGNIWAIMYDPALYPDPYRFDPERYLKKQPETDPRRFMFGFGRRVCPGQHVASNGALIMGAAFLSVFNITTNEETIKRVEECAQEPWKMFRACGTL